MTYQVARDLELEDRSKFTDFYTTKRSDMKYQIVQDRKIDLSDWKEADAYCVFMNTDMNTDEWQEIRGNVIGSWYNDDDAYGIESSCHYVDATPAMTDVINAALAVYGDAVFIITFCIRGFAFIRF